MGILSTADEAARVVAEATGATVDEVKPALRGLDDSTLAKIATDNVTQTPIRAVETASEGASKSALFVGGGVGAAGVGAGAGIAGKEFFEAKQVQTKAKNRQQTREWLRQILKSDALSKEQKAAALRKAIQQGLFNDLGANGKGGGSILSNKIVQGFGLLIVLYFGGKALSNYAGSAGGGGSGGGGN